MQKYNGITGSQMKKNRSSLDLLSMTELMDMFNLRVTSMAEILNIPSSSTYQHLYLTVCDRAFHVLIENPDMSIHDVFDETTSAIGDAWMWRHRNFYFAYESDAVWFKLRWM